MDIFKKLLFCSCMVLNLTGAYADENPNNTVNDPDLQFYQLAAPVYLATPGAVGGIFPSENGIEKVWIPTGTSIVMVFKNPTYGLKVIYNPNFG